MKKYKKLFMAAVLAIIAFLCVFSNLSTMRADGSGQSNTNGPVEFSDSILRTGASEQAVLLTFSYTDAVYYNGNTNDQNIFQTGTAKSYTWRNKYISLSVLYMAPPEVHANRGEYIPMNDFYISLPENSNYTVKRTSGGGILKVGYGNRYDHAAGDGEFQIEIVRQEEVREYGRTNIYYIQAFATFKVDSVAPNARLSCGDNGYANSSVTYTCTDNVSGIKTAEYCRSTSGEFTENSFQSVSHSGTFTEPGNYTLKITDNAGLTRVKRFTIDKSAPTLTLSGVGNGGITKQTVKATWTEEFTAVSSQLANEGDELTAKYSRSETGEYPAQATSQFSSGTEFSENGKYLITITDRAGNRSSYTFTIDKTAPVVTVSVSDGTHTKQDVTVSFSDAETNATALYGYTTEAIYPPTPGTEFSTGRKFTSEGSYTLRVTDEAGNTVNYRFTIDKSAPVINSYRSYTNTMFTMTARDKYGQVASWEYTKNGGNVQRHNGASVTLGGGENGNGVWRMRVIDELGNTSNWVTVNHAYRETFGNAESVFNTYFTPSYYVVNLSQKNYASCYGAYSFSEYEYALNYAVRKEWECRVIELDGGRSWNYVTATNENARQIYTDRAELDAVVDKYARKNIGDRKIIGKNGAKPNNPTDANGITRADALTSQLTRLPSLLSAYSDMRYMLALRDQCLETPASIVDGNRSTASIRFISDGITIREGQENTLRYGDPFYSVVNEQGWYLITESDVCGNLERYLIFLDMQQPDLIAEVTYGSGENEVITFNQTFVNENTAAMRYTEFTVQALMDNIDAFTMIIISGRNLDGRYVSGDELPILCYENGYYGAYTITVYDRSRNMLEFVIYIAGEAPTLKHTSLTNETACTFTIVLNDSPNGIAEIGFYKIHFDGSEERLYVDSFNTAVCAENLVYRMNVGGKYVFEFSDLYGRKIRTEPIFYMKGLPAATLRGVKDGGLTKNDVSVIYDATVTAELYKKAGGEWIVAELYELTQGISGNTLRITAAPETTAVYKVLLYVTSDRNLFSEYTFEIDGILPIVEIFTERGAVVSPETVTTQNFYITWKESGYKAFYKKQGAVSEIPYTRETLITSDGTYTFTVYDEARNELTFVVTLDNSVSYTLDGTYALLEDGSYITRGNFVFTLVEPWSQFDVIASNGLTVVNGQKLDTDGTYRIYAKDMYGNEMSLVLIIDKLPPVPVITTQSGENLTDGARIKDAFCVSCEEENVSIVYSQGNNGYVVYDGGELNEAGTYSFKLTDRVGNSIVITVIIDREVQYRIDGTYTELNGVVCSRSWIQVTALEAYTAFTIETEEGALVDNTKRITAEGTYYVQITDVAGNVAAFTFVIDKTAPPIRIITESGKEYVGAAITNESFRVVCDETEAKIKVSYNGTTFSDYTGAWLTASGRYTVRVIDVLGNVSETEIMINKDVSLTVNGVYVMENGIYVSKTWLSITLDEEMKAFYIRGQDGAEYGADTRIKAEGIYEVYARDMQGNEITFRLEIDLTAPEIELIGVVTGGVTNSPVTVEFDGHTAAYYRLNGGDKVEVKSGTVLDAEGVYLLSVRDAVGNVANVTFEIDLHVDVAPSVDLSDGRVITGTVSFQFGEEVNAKLSFNGQESAYARGELAAAGDYVLTVTDDCGNVEAYAWTIVPKRARSYSLCVSAYDTVSVVKDGAVFNVRIDDGNLTLTESGCYVLLFESGETVWELALEVDNVAPTLDFENTGKSIKISNPNKSALTYKLYLNGEEKAFRMQSFAELTAIGSYRLVCTDDVGNVTEYVFELNYLSPASVALIAVAATLTLVGICALVVFRFRRNRF